jgi:hypothetical protein
MKNALPFVFAAAMILAAASPPQLSAAQEGRIQIIPGPDSVGPATRLTVLIADGDLNAQAGRINEYEADDVELVTFRTDRGELGEASPDLEETGENTGVFAFTIQLETDEESCDNDRFTSSGFDAVGGSDPSIGACPGDILSISYEDFHTASGEEIISMSVPIKSWDPEFAAVKDRHDLVDRVIIDITDPDANRDPDMVDSIQDIRVSSDSDAVGKGLSALETGDNTGIFKLSFSTSLEPQGNLILVKPGDRVSVRYTDEFPADLTLAEKVFTFILSMGGTVEIGDTLAPSPARPDATGPLAIGRQTTFFTTLTSQRDQPLQFVEIFDIRGINGTTVFLAWQTVTLEPREQKDIGVSWTPNRSGDYEIRTFALTGFDNPRIFSLIWTSDVTVS